MKTMTTTQKKRTAILAAIVLTALIAVMLAAVSYSTESDDGIELTDAVLSEQVAEEIVADVNLDGEVEADVLEAPLTLHPLSTGWRIRNRFGLRIERLGRNKCRSIPPGKSRSAMSADMTSPATRQRTQRHT